jgi:hypothetical protein
MNEERFEQYMTSSWGLNVYTVTFVKTLRL